LNNQSRATSHLLARDLRRTRFYTIWLHMNARCGDPRVPSYKHYGGRGITVCDRWHHNFEAFVDDMHPTYTDGMTIERIDNDGPYSPENCRWATQAEQALNKRNNRLLTYDGHTQPLAAWAREYGLGISCLWLRLSRGWPVERALTEPVGASKYPIWIHSGLKSTG
jgi:hypothetical protein